MNHHPVGGLEYIIRHGDKKLDKIMDEYIQLYWKIDQIIKIWTETTGICRFYRDINYFEIKPNGIEVTVWDRNLEEKYILLDKKWLKLKSENVEKAIRAENGKIQRYWE